MIGRFMRSRIVKAIALVSAVVLAYLKREASVAPAFNLIEGTSPVLDKEENVHEIGFSFPTAQHNRLLIQMTEPVIKCKDDMNQFSHKIFDAVSATVIPTSSTIMCIKVFNELSFFGPDAVIRENVKFYERDIEKPKPPAFFRAVMLNTAGEEGICVAQNNKKTCLPSFHVMDFIFLSANFTIQQATKWGGTTEKVRKMIERAERHSTHVEKACQKFKGNDKRKDTIEECKNKTTIAMRQFVSTLYQLGNQTAADKSRVISKNNCSLFSVNSRPVMLEKKIISLPRNNMI